MYVYLRRYALPREKKAFIADDVDQIIIENSLDDPDLLYAKVFFHDGRVAEVFDVIDGEVM